MKNKSNKRFTYGAIIGVVVGLGIGILPASNPQSVRSANDHVPSEAKQLQLPVKFKGNTNNLNSMLALSID